MPNGLTFQKESKAKSVQQMFSRIAGRYDLMNRLMTAGQDRSWRRKVIQLASIPSKGVVLDIGAGTGDLSREVLRRHPDCTVMASDFTLEMMRVGARLKPQLEIWCSADAEQLPFPDNTFDAVISGFLLRNVNDLRQTLSEQYRVLKTGGRVVSLDTTRPSKNFLYPVIEFHLNKMIPFLGKWIAGDGDAYTYLPQSTQNFLLAEDLAELMKKAGFRRVSFSRFMLGTIAIHWGVKE